MYRSPNCLHENVYYRPLLFLGHRLLATLGSSSMRAVGFSSFQTSLAIAVLGLKAEREGGLPWEGAHPDDWATMKPTTPTGSLPVMELQDGTMMGESATCKKACAAAAGLLGWS